MRNGAGIAAELAKKEIDTREKIDSASIMPTGLLDGYGTREIATLFAYLQRGPNLPAKPASE